MVFWWDGGVGVLTGEAASPEHVLSDAFRVTHFEGTEIGQLAWKLEKLEKFEVKFSLHLEESTGNRSAAKPNWEYLGTMFTMSHLSPVPISDRHFPYPHLMAFN